MRARGRWCFIWLIILNYTSWLVSLQAEVVVGFSRWNDDTKIHEWELVVSNSLSCTVLACDAAAVWWVVEFFVISWGLQNQKIKNQPAKKKRPSKILLSPGFWNRPNFYLNRPNNKLPSSLFLLHLRWNNNDDAASRSFTTKVSQ